MNDVLQCLACKPLLYLDLFWELETWKGLQNLKKNELDPPFHIVFLFASENSKHFYGACIVYI